MATLTDYRADLDALLATGVDASTWTPAIKDAALRLALQEVDVRVVYESSFPVISGGAVQDLSSLPALDEVLALAYPWHTGGSFVTAAVRWRMVADQTVYLEGITPQPGEVIRVRHTMRHAIQALDGAAATTLPARHRGLVGLAAAAWCCDLRRRQVSENPALPRESGSLLAELAMDFRTAFSIHAAKLQPAGVLVWAGVGE